MLDDPVHSSPPCCASTFGTLVFVIFGRTSVQPWNTYWNAEVNDKSEEIPALINSDEV